MAGPEAHVRYGPATPTWKVHVDPTMWIAGIRALMLQAPIETFRGGTVEFFFHPNLERDGYEVATMYVKPPRDQRQHGIST